MVVPKGGWRGALLDYCCYGACLSRWFFGEKSVAAYGMTANFNSPYGNVEDYATITVRFPQGVAILEVPGPPGIQVFPMDRFFTGLKVPWL